ncbi:MAG: ribosome silencing factor [Epsilonproteobacteria bacterium]|nr:ribosome silencing factor [Campylobacterota bacterium]NPA89113.1 ribosome silencing factor [Campylobacterota bacterium]
MKERVKRIEGLIDEKKGLDILTYDLRGRGYYVDFVVVATTMADRHGQALLDYLKEKLKPAGEEFFRVDEGDDWIIIDLGDILVHLMSQEYRARYQIDTFLEELKGSRGR